MIFVFSLIENPEFKSQAKEELTTKHQNFGSQFAFDEQSMKKIEKMELVSKIVDLLKFKESKALNIYAQVLSRGRVMFRSNY